MRKWSCCSPILDYSDASNVFQQPVDLGVGVSIKPLPDWYKHGRKSKIIEGLDDHSAWENGLAVCAEYESPAPNIPDGELHNQQKKINNLLLYIPLAFWLVKPTSFTCGRIVHFCTDENDGLANSIYEGTLIRGLPDNDDPFINTKDLEVAKSILVSFTKIVADGTLRSALRIVHKALTESMWDVRFALNWVALESLYGAGHGELRFRLSTYIALHLSKNESEAKVLSSEVRELYDMRCKIVHGLRYAKLKPAEALDLCKRLEQIVRRSLTSILLTSDKDHFDGSKREDYLTNLVFQRQYNTAS